MTDASVVRFSYVTIPTAVWVRVGFAAAVAVGGFSMFLDPANGQLDSALATVLLLQMFAVSNGFASAAGRGHFDPILVSGRPRWLVALGAAGASALPGAIAWSALLAVGAVAGEPLASLAAPHRQAAFVVVSSVGWALGVPLPRLAGGVLWSMVVAALLVSRTLFERHLQAIERIPSGMADVLTAAAACVVCPFVFLGDFAAAADRRVVLVALSVAALAVAAATRHIERRDFALQELE